jgi:hypothetical protein
MQYLQGRCANWLKTVLRVGFILNSCSKPPLVPEMTNVLDRTVIYPSGTDENSDGSSILTDHVGYLQQ